MTPVALLLTIPLAIAVTVASLGGAVGGAYARETASWAAQGVAQDYVNLVVVVPILTGAAWLAGHGSLRGLLVWIGVLLYLVYSYLLYALCVHFNVFFLAYVAALGLSFYATVCGLSVVVTRAYTAARAFRHPASIGMFLVIVGVAFAALWLSDVLAATWAGRAPASAAEAGLPVNPVHVLDLAIAVPGTIIIGVLVIRRHAFGLALAVPVMTFLAVMGVAIVAMWWQLTMQGIAGAGSLPVPVAIVVGVAIALTASALRDVGS